MQDQIIEVKAKTDIVTILSNYIDLKKSGRNFKAICPFHSEKTPSFMVSQELQIYKCFGCGEGGDVFDFLQKYEGMDFYESLKFLADKIGIRLKPLSPGQRGERETIYQLNKLALHFYHYLLTQHSIGKSALDYLMKDRKLKPSTIKTFGIGYSPDKPFALKKYLVDKKKNPINELEKAGLVFMKNDLAFDRFRGRVVFPLHDHRGNVLGFAGRILPSERNKELAKYINSPETPAYHKSNVLYGLHISKRDIKKLKVAIVVEGELDMISCWQAGIKNVVAIKGSALTQEQIKLISRYAPSVVLALDADIAGNAAAKRGIQIAEKEGLEIKVANLGQYKDPDDLARKDPEKLISVVNKAVGVWDYLIDSTFSQLSGESGLDKAKLSKEIIPILASVDDVIVRSHYTQMAAGRLGVPFEAVSEQIVKYLSGTSGAQVKVEGIVKKESKSIREVLEERLLAVAFKHNPGVILDINGKKLIRTPLTKRIYEEFVSYMKKNKTFDPSLFAGELSKELVEGFTQMVLKEIEGLENDSVDTFNKEIDLIKRSLAIVNIKERKEKISENLRKAEDSGSLTELKKYQQEFRKITLELKNLEENQ